MTLKLILAAALALTAGAAAPKRGKPMTTAEKSKFYSFEMKDNAGKARKLGDYKGQVLLVVNTASKCGLTPQYKGLEEVYQKYKGKGFAVAAFPANEFGAQEPGSDAEIKNFCALNYKTTFDLYSKIVVKGPNIHPLYAYLTKESPFTGDIGWNFAKFLIAKDGTVAARFDPKVEPNSPEIVKKVEELLAN
ncbi:MAG: glutathione peroxidase [Elusimicrobia bacterium]|nr:glutathione peroxidase [Elusimicrobiota bacterium]